METDIASEIRAYIETAAPPVGMPDLARAPAAAGWPRRAAAVCRLNPRRTVAAVAAVAAAVAGGVVASQSLTQSPPPPSARVALAAAVRLTRTQSFREVGEFHNTVLRPFSALAEPSKTAGIEQCKTVHCWNTRAVKLHEVVFDGFVYKFDNLRSTLQFHQPFSSVDIEDPFGLLSDLLSAGQVREIGPASGPGWSGTRYAYTLGYQHTPGYQHGTVVVDQLGRVRMISMFIANPSGGTWGETVTFSDFGVVVHVKA